MSVSRNQHEAANDLAQIIKNSELPISANVTDASIQVSGSVRKSGLMLVLFVHHRENENNGGKNYRGEGQWDRSCRYLRLRREELDCCIRAGIRDIASNGLCVVGKLYQDLRVWDARTGQYWTKTFTQDNIIQALIDPHGMKS